MPALAEIVARYTVADHVPRETLVQLAERLAENVDRDEIVDLLIAGPPPLMLGDRAAQQGDFDLARDLYCAAVRDADADAEDLSNSGRFVLLRAEPRARALSPEDFDDDPEFDIYADLPFRMEEGPAFPSSYQLGLLELATESFARSLAPHLPGFADPAEWMTWADLVQLLLGLDGLRCGLLLLGAFDDVEEVTSEILSASHTWLVEDGPLEFAEPFRDRAIQTRAWLRGRQGLPLWGAISASTDDDTGAPTTSSRLEHESVTDQIRLIRWQGGEILDFLRSLGPELQAAVVDAINTDPFHDSETVDAELRSEIGSGWNHLPVEVRARFVQAERLRRVLSRHDGLDWSSVVVQYSRAVEVLLAKSLRDELLTLLSRGSGNRFEVEMLRLRERSASWALGDYGRELARVAQRSRDRRRTEQVSKALNRFANDFRNPAAHGDTFFEPERARLARVAVLGSGGLLSELQQLRL